MSIESRLTGALWGYLVGDAIGARSFVSPLEAGLPRSAISGSPDQPVGTWSEGGVLMLAMLDSLLAVGFDPEDQAQRIVDAVRDDTYTAGGWRSFDVGRQTMHAIEAFERGVPAEECGSTDERLSGAAAIKRILALALVERSVPDEEVVDHAMRAARIVDGTEGAQLACAQYVLIVRGLLAGETDRAQVADEAGRRLGTVREARTDRRDSTTVVRQLAGSLVRRGAAEPARSLWAAWDAFLGATSYDEAIARAVRSGGDTATTGALAGGLAGARWGIDGIPAAALLAMRGRGIAGRLLDRLLAPERPNTTIRRASRVDWLDLGGVPGLQDAGGRLGVGIVPGTDPDRHRGVRLRNLEPDVRRLRAVEGVDVGLLLVLDHELAPVRPATYVEALASHGIEVLRHPVPDLEVPTSHAAFAATLELVAVRLRAGRSVLIASRGCRGRMATAVGCLLRDAGLPAAEALAVIQAGHPGAIETPGQEAFIRSWEPSGA